jgi:hypothetical protein
VIGTAGKSIGVCTALLMKLVSSHCVVNAISIMFASDQPAFSAAPNSSSETFTNGFDQGLGKHDRCLALGIGRSSLMVDSDFVLVDLGEVAPDIGVGGETIVAAVSFWGSQCDAVTDLDVMWCSASP